MSRIGVISDTHGLLRPEAVAALAGVSHIVHAGDVGSADVLAQLSRIAPVTAVRGNNDRAAWAADLAITETVEIEGRSIYVLHDLAELDLDPATAGFAVVVTGHSHKPKIVTKDGVLFMNPGSAGPRRFKLPVTLGTLDVSGSGIRAEIHELTLAARS
jgi:putative phosphoesterase